MATSKLVVRTLNKISPAGLARFNPDVFRTTADVSEPARGGAGIAFVRAAPTALPRRASRR